MASRSVTDCLQTWPPSSPHILTHTCLSSYQNSFTLLLNLGWSCDFLWSIKYGKRDGVWVLDLRFCMCPLWIQPLCKIARLSYWVMRERNLDNPVILSFPGKAPDLWSPLGCSSPSCVSSWQQPHEWLQSTPFGTEEPHSLLKESWEITHCCCFQVWGKFVMQQWLTDIPSLGILEGSKWNIRDRKSKGRAP